MQEKMEFLNRNLLELVADVFVPGTPVSNQRSRTSRGRHYTPKKTTQHRAKVFAHLANVWPSECLYCPLVLDAVFVFARGKTVKREHMTVVYDLDNLGKTIGDCQPPKIKRLWGDDSQFIEMRLRKEYGETEGTFIKIWKLKKSKKKS